MESHPESQNKKHEQENQEGQSGVGGQDADALPDGSGTNREGQGSEQGQEDGGQSFDAG